MKSNLINSERNGRRKFIKSTGAAVIYSAAALNMGFPNPMFGQNSNTLKVGLIGCGGRGSGAAAQALNADPDVVLYAMADAFEDRLNDSLEMLKKAHGGKVQVEKERQFVGFDAYQKLIDSGVDVVLLATPPAFRPDHITAAVDAGKHIFCEKPVAVDAPGVRKVKEAVKKSKEKNLSIVSGFTLRYSNSNRELFGRILDGQIGDVKTISHTRNGGGVWYKPRQENWSDMEYQMRNWYYYNWLSGDFIVEMIVHGLDLMSWSMGNKMPLRVTGNGGRQVRVEEKYGNIYDHFGIEYEFENEVRGFNFCRHWPDTSHRNTVEVAGTKGNAYFGGGKTRITGKSEWQFEGEENNPYQVQHNELFAAIREGDPINDGDIMTNSTMMAIISRMAAYSGQTLTWEEALNSDKVLGPKSFSWDLKYSGPGVAIPGVTKALQ